MFGKSTCRFNIFSDAESIEESVALGDVYISGEHFEGGRLSRSVDSQQSEALAAPHTEAQVINGLESVIVPFHQISAKQKKMVKIELR